MWRNLIIIIAALSAPTHVMAQEGRQQTIEYPSDQGAEIGQGWNSVGTHPTNATCVSGVIRSDTGQKQNLFYRRIFDTESLMRTLAVSTQVKAGLAAGIGGSGSASFASSTKVSQENTNILAVAEVTKGASFLRPRTPSNGAVHAGSIRLDIRYRNLAQNDIAEFRRICGDSFVSSKVSGARLFAMYSFLTRTQEERQNVEASVSGNYGALSGDASIKSTIASYQSSSRLTIQSSAAGGSGGSIARTPEQIDAAIGALPETARTATSPFRIVVQPYESLENFPKVTLTGQLSVLDSMTRLFYQFINLQLQIQDILISPNDFVFEGSSTLQATRSALDKIDDARVALAQEISRCSPLPGSCVHPTSVPRQDYEYRTELPVRKGSFLNDDQLRTILTRREELALNIGRAQRQEFDPPKHLNRKFHNDMALFSYQKADAQAKVEQDRIEPIRQEALIAERVRFWISEPARLRCGERVTEPCISQQQVGQYELKMRSIN